MSDYPQFNQPAAIWQSPLDYWCQVLTPLYQQFVPLTIRERRNIQLAKLTDVQLLAVLCWQTELDI